MEVMPEIVTFVKHSAFQRGESFPRVLAVQTVHGTIRNNNHRRDHAD
jgi:hypothetical protein